MKKQLAILTAALCMAASGCTSNAPASGSTASLSPASSAPASSAGPSGAAKDTEGITKLVVAYRSPSIPADIAQISAAISDITRKSIQVEVELMPISTGTYMQQMTLMLAGGEPLDVCSTYSTLYSSAYAKGQLLPLDDLIAQYGKGITENVEEMFLKCGKIGGETYAVVCNHDQVRGYGAYLMRKDILDKYGIDYSQVDSYDKLEEIFRQVKEHEPDMIMVSPSVKGTFLVYNTAFDNLGNNFGVLMDYGQTTTVTNLFTTEWYSAYLNRIRGWYESGFISKDVTTEPEAASTMVKAGRLFSYPDSYKPGSLRQHSNACGTEMVMARCEKAQTTSAAAMAGMWSIPLNCERPDKAMQFINELFSNKEVIELLCNGIEDKHYVRLEDGTIDFPQGITSATSSYVNPMAWMMGNQFLTSVWTGDSPTMWEDMKAFNKTGIVSKAMGFTFDNASIQTELTAVQNTYDEYKLSLENGAVDPDATLPQMVQKLETAGIQKIMDEKQRQLDAWLAKQ